MPESPLGWWLEVISSQRDKGFLVVESWSWLSKQSFENGDEPYIMHKAYMQIRETHQRIVVGANKGVLWQPDKAQPPVEITDFAEFERTGQAVKYKSETVASKLEWEAQDGKKIAPFVFPTYYAVDEPLDPQFVRETFFLPEEDQMLANEYAFLARAEANKWSGDWRHSTLNLAVGASADDSRIFNATWNNTSTLMAMGNQINPNNYEHQSRFLNVTIANGATINSAVYTLQGSATDDLTDTNTVNVIFGFEAADNPGQIADYADFVARSLTATTTTANAVALFDAGVDYNAPSVAGSLQDVVNRGGFTSGNAINIFCRNNGSSAEAYRTPKSYDADSSSAVCPRLAIDYSAGGGATVGGPLAGSHHLATGGVLLGRLAH